MITAQKKTTSHPIQCDVVFYAQKAPRKECF